MCFKDSKAAYQHLPVHPTKAEEWDVCLAFIRAQLPRVYSFLDGRLSDGYIKAKTGYTRKQAGDLPKCKPDGCTGNGCMVLVNARYAVLDDKDSVCKGGIVSDCLNCILMGITCAIRTTQAPIALPPMALATQKSKGKGKEGALGHASTPLNKSSSRAPVFPRTPGRDGRADSGALSPSAQKVRDTLLERGNNFFDAAKVVGECYNLDAQMPSTTSGRGKTTSRKPPPARLPDITRAMSVVSASDFAAGNGAGRSPERPHQPLAGHMVPPTPVSPTDPTRAPSVASHSTPGPSRLLAATPSPRANTLPPSPISPTTPIRPRDVMCPPPPPARQSEAASGISGRAAIAPRPRAGTLPARPGFNSRRSAEASTRATRQSHHTSPNHQGPGRVDPHRPDPHRPRDDYRPRHDYRLPYPRARTSPPPRRDSRARIPHEREGGEWRDARKRPRIEGRNL